MRDALKSGVESSVTGMRSDIVSSGLACAK